MSVDAGKDILSIYNLNSLPEKDFLAVFDIDETLINIKSMFSFLKFYYVRKYGFYQGTAIYQLKINEVKKLTNIKSREEINKEFYRLFYGEKICYLKCCAEQWFDNANKGSIFFKESCFLLKTLRAHGAKIVFLSGSAEFILSPIVSYLGGGDILGITLEIRDGYATGEIEGFQTIGSGKRDALASYIKKKNISMDNSWAFGDHISDLPFLEMASYPCIMAGNKDLEDIARTKKWPVLSNKNIAE